MNATAPIVVTQRPAYSDDEAFLLELYSSTRAEEVAAWGWEKAQQEGFLKMQFLARQQAYQWQYPEADHRIILLGERPIGQIIVARLETEIRLVDIALRPEHRGTGLGTALILELLDEALRTGRPVRLSVERANRARRLYERLGFACTGDDGMYFTMEWRPADQSHD
ncbi:MAG: GNAT family N-acetyltransferase [Blastocatellia bacterium]